MAAEDRGWPLGLQIMNTRLGFIESIHVPPAEPHSWRMPSTSTSFSAFSSSYLDTESSSSFLQDHSVSLGRLLGIRPQDRRSRYFSNSRQPDDEDERVPLRDPHMNVSSGKDEVPMCKGICIPLLLGLMLKISPRKSKPRP